MTKQWKIALDEIEHDIVYNGSTLSGNFKMLIDGEYREYVPTIVKKVGLFAKIDVADSNIILQVSLNGKEANIAVDGVFVDSQIPLSDETYSKISSMPSGGNELLQKKVKAGFTSFSSFVILTYLNLVLIVLNLDISFPFSAMVPQFPLAFGKLFYEEDGILFMYIVGIAVSLIATSVYLLLFFLSKRRIAAIWTTLIFVIIDTVVLILFSLNEITVVLIDLAFHVWVIWSLIGLLKAKLQMSRELNNELLNSGVLDEQTLRQKE